MFSGESFLINKVKKLHDPDCSTINIKVKDEPKNKPDSSSSSMPPPKRYKQCPGDDETWVCWGNSGVCLRMSDKETVLLGLELNDIHIDMFQKLLKDQFPLLNGLSSPLKVSVTGKWIGNFLQVYHCRNNHWITASTIGCKIGIVNIYDSLYTDQLTRSKVEETFPDLKITIMVLPVQKQFGVKDCGLFSLAFATYLIIICPQIEGTLPCLEMKQVSQFQ